ncbi:MAG TPA: mycofactocin radical SAM maturase [Candidatus Dormibacteraeota bacterium]|jgi:mycofactocin radical SAM maturase|nr:mycofactocin radical SAM maturase [Candidatus Dormibacteraeota bacterium]
MRYEALSRGLNAPICLTWEITYACNLQCVHCLSSSGRRADDELTTEEALRLIDDWARMRVFYINVGGGEPMVRPDFRRLMEHAVESGVGVKFSTNGSRMDTSTARWIASGDYLDVQISLDGVDAPVNDAIRGEGSYAHARNAMDLLAAEGFPFKLNHVVTRRTVDDLDRLHDLATGYGAQLRVTRLRPSGRGLHVWEQLRLTQAQNRTLYAWLRAHPDVLTGDSFFHLSALGEPLDGLNMCGAGRIVCCVDPRGDVFACPFVLVEEFRAGNVRTRPFEEIWRDSPLFDRLRGEQAGGGCESCGAYASCHGGCMAVKHFAGLALDDPDPECVRRPETGPLENLIPLALAPRALRVPAALATRYGDGGSGGIVEGGRWG